MPNFYQKYKAPIALIILMILFGGIYSLMNLQSGLFPNITFPKIKIIADNGEQPVDKMMVTVTVPLENAIKRVPELKLLRSTTSRGSCEISAFMKWGSDIDLGKQRIEAQINDIKQNLPPGVGISIEKMNPSILPVMGFSLEGAGKSPIELRDIAEYTVKPMFSRVAGVSDVAVTGGKIKEYHIILDEAKMSGLGITPMLVSTALSQTNFISSNGLSADYNRLYLTLTDASIKDKSQLERTVIQSTDKSRVTLRDISTVEIGEKREYIRINANGKDVPLIAVSKQPEANLIEVNNAIANEFKEIRRILPKGVTIRPYYNQSDFVIDVISSLKDVLWIGLLLAIIVTILFLRSFKASSVILVTIPVTLGLTLIIMLLFGYTLDIMTIGAIAAAIGLIIDDAIVVVEQIHRTHEEHPEEASSQLVIKAIRYLLPAMIASSLSTIVIFLPFVLMGGVAGSYFKVMTNTMIITLVCSFFVVWVCLPVIYLLFSGETHKIKSKAKEIKTKKWVYFFIRRPIISILFSLALIGVTIYILPKLPSGFLPEMDEGSIVLDYTSPPGSSLEATNAMLRQVDSIVQYMPEVESYSRRTGTQMGFFITEPNYGDYLIQLKKKRTKTTDEVSDEIRKQIESSLPALRVDFGQVIGDMLGDLMASVQPIEIKIFGDDHQTLEMLADSVSKIVENVKGTADAFNGIVVAGPEIDFDPNSGALLRYGLNPADLQLQLQTKIEGSIVGDILEPMRTVNIRMMENRVPPSLDKLKQNSIFLTDGKLKPLAEFADIRVRKGVTEIDRENLKPMIAVTARLNGRDLGSALQEIQTKINKNISLPTGYQIVYGGSYAEQQQAFRELLIIMILAVLLVFTVILFLFRKMLAALAIIFIAILGMAGSAIALYLTGTPLNVGSYTGMIMIIGIIGENAIFTYWQYAEARSKSMDRDRSLVYSISTRLRPKLMTALGAITALMPLALGVGVGAQMHEPLAIAIIGGLVAALPLLLIVLPSLLRMLEKK